MVLVDEEDEDDVDLELDEKEEVVEEEEEEEGDKGDELCGDGFPFSTAEFNSRFSAGK